MSQDKPDEAQAVRQTNQSFFFEFGYLFRRASVASPQAAGRRRGGSRACHSGVP